MRRRFEYLGMAVVLMIYLAMAFVLLLERSGIRYQLQDVQVALLPQEQISLSAYEEQEAECLVLIDRQEPSSLQAAEQFEQIFKDMKVGCRWVDVRTEELPELSAFRTVTVLLSDFSPLRERILELSDWVEDGGKAFLALPPQTDPTYMLIEQKLGIVESSYENELVDSIRFADGFLIGGNRTWPVMDGYDSARKVRLQENVKVYAYDGDEKALPLIWRSDYGKGRFVVGNFGIMSKAVRGLYAASYTLLEDAFAYPVINGATFYLDDFPSPVPAGDGEKIRADYGMTVEEFYINVWWPDMLKLAEKYGVLYTGVVIENYDDETDGEIVQEKDFNPFLYFGEMLLKEGGEIGLHGYNHQPLSLDDVEYGQELPYNTWADENAMCSAVEELMRFVGEMFPESLRYVYVPPSNVLSAQGRALLSSYYPRIHTVASTYFEDEFVYEQEFGVAADGIVEQPRTISGGILNDYAMLAALSELNFHLVSNHFIHPDDVLDEDRGADIGWEKLCSNLDNYMDWLQTSCPALRELTGTELSGAVQRYSSIGVKREITDGQLKLTLDHFVDEAWLLVRMEERQKPSVSGGTLTQITESLWLLRADQSEVTIHWSK